MRNKLNMVIANLRRNNVYSMFIPTAKEDRAKLMEMIKKEVWKGGVISLGGSTTPINLAAKPHCYRM